MRRNINHLVKCLLSISIVFFLSSCSTKKVEKDDHGFPLSNIDSTANPADNFYQYADGNWVKNNPVPDAYTVWGSFSVLQEKNNDVLHKILTDAASDKNAKQGSIEQKIGDFFYTGMDTVKIENDGIKPIQDELNTINSLKSKEDLIKEIAYQHIHLGGPLFSFGSDIDAKNSKMQIAELDQGGLGLPDRDYYLKNDPHSKEIRDKYVQHVSNMFKLAGENEKNAQQDANNVLKLETELAEVSMSRVDRRDPKKTYNKMPLADLKKLSPGFNWADYFKETGVSDPGDINVSETGFFKSISGIFKDTPMDMWIPYLRWNLLHSAANYLDTAFVNESFDFYGKYLSGAKTMQPRWKRVMYTVSRRLREAVGQEYVKVAFPPEAKERAKKIVKNLLEAMRERISNLDWMGPETKKQALHKLASFTVKIGYPDKWIDYSTLEIKRDSYIANVKRALEFNYKRDINKIGKPVDPTEWYMSPQTVNAYNSSKRNEIVFPAAILQPPFFNQKADDAINYGAMGAVIGHETTHSFDDKGRMFDAEGNLKDWWTADDNKKFQERAQRIIDEFDSFVAVDTMHVNGRLTEGENIADLGGLNVALTAFKKTDEYKSNKKIDGFTPLQRFFLGWAQVWESNIRDKTKMMLVKVDPHSPPMFRVNGPLRNLPEFWQAFNVKEGDPMRAPADKIVKIW